MGLKECTDPVVFEVTLQTSLKKKLKNRKLKFYLFLSPADLIFAFIKTSFNENKCITKLTFDLRPSVRPLGGTMQKL